MVGNRAIMPTSNPLRFPMFQRAASTNDLISQWVLTILTCLVMLGSCRCSRIMISKVLSAFEFSMSIANYQIISKVWPPRVFQTSVCVTFGARLRWAAVSFWVATLHGLSSKTKACNTNGIVTNVTQHR